MKALLCKRYGPPDTLALLKGGSTVGAFQGSFHRNESEAYKAQMAEFFKLVVQGKLKPAITAHYQLDQRPTPCATLLCDPSPARSCSLLSGAFTDGVSAERLHKTARSG